MDTSKHEVEPSKALLLRFLSHLRDVNAKPGVLANFELERLVDTFLQTERDAGYEAFVRDVATSCVRCGLTKEEHVKGSHSVDGPMALFCRDKGTSWTEFLSVLDAQVCPFYGAACTSDPPWDGISCGQAPGKPVKGHVEPTSYNMGEGKTVPQFGTGVCNCTCHPPMGLGRMAKEVPPADGWFASNRLWKHLGEHPWIKVSDEDKVLTVHVDGAYWPQFRNLKTETDLNWETWEGYTVVVRLMGGDEVRPPCTLENCGHMRQLDAIVDQLGMKRGTRSVLDELRARAKGPGTNLTNEGSVSVRAPTSTEHEILLGEALRKVLVFRGMLRKDAALTGAELLAAAEVYVATGGAGADHIGPIAVDAEGRLVWSPLVKAMVEATQHYVKAMEEELRLRDFTPMQEELRLRDFTPNGKALRAKYLASVAALEIR